MYKKDIQEIYDYFQFIETHFSNEIFIDILIGLYELQMYMHGMGDEKTEKIAEDSSEYNKIFYLLKIFEKLTEHSSKFRHLTYYFTDKKGL